MKSLTSENIFLSKAGSEEYYMSILDHVSEGFVSLDKKLRYVYANKRMAEITRCRPELFKGKYIWDMFPSGISTEMQHAINRALLEQVYVCHSGYYSPYDVWLETRIYPSAEGVFVFLHEVNDNIRAEKKYRKNTNRFAALIENTQDIVLLINESGRITFVSPALEHIIGYSADEMHIDSAWVLNHLSEATDLKKELANVLQNPGIPFQHALQLKNKNGRQIWLEGAMINLLADENTRAIVGNYRDVSEKKKLLEQQLLPETIINSTYDAIFSHNVSGHINSWNNSAAELLGYTPDEAIGMHFSRLVPKEKLAEINNNVEHISQGGHIKNFETVYLRKDGSSVHVSLSISPIHNNNKTNSVSVIARDITERKISEERLKDSENNLLTIIENSTESFVLTDNRFVIKAFNTKAKDNMLLSHGSRSICEGSDFLHHIPLSWKEQFRSVFSKVLQHGQVIQYETEVYHKNNVPYWHYASFIPVTENGLVSGICIATKDVTEEKKAVEQLRQSEENLRAVFENTVQGFILLDPDGTIKLFNKNALKYCTAVYGRSLEAGKLVYDFIEESRVEFFMNAISKVLAGETITYSRHYTASDGKGMWFDFSINPVRTADQITGICITGIDITEKKLVELEREFEQNNLESLINNTIDLMWSVDKNYSLITCNNPFADLFSLTSGKPPKKGSSILLKEFGKETLQRFKGYYDRAFMGESFTELEYGEVPEPRWSDISFYPIYKGAEIVGTACFSRDITEIKKNAHEKEILIKELSKNNKDLQQFAYITSHNLRGPIANLMGLTNLLDNYHTQDSTLTKILNGIKTATFRFDETIRDLSTILTIRDNTSTQQEKLLFEPVIKKIVGQYEILLLDCQGQVHTDFSAAPAVMFNKAYLESIFVNLITNAIKYRALTRPLEIVIKTEIIGDFIELRFSDNGIGLDTTLHKQKLFKLYQRFHNEREGKGLGLFLIKSQIEAQGGSIFIESEVDKGTCFILKFINSC